MIQHKLEGGLLALGQFQHALDEVLAWMSHTEEMLSEQKKSAGDPKAIEIELAKHNVRRIFTCLMCLLAMLKTAALVNKQAVAYIHVILENGTRLEKINLC